VYFKSFDIYSNRKIGNLDTIRNLQYYRRPHEVDTLLLKKFPAFFYNPNVQLRFQKKTVFEPNLSHFNPTHTLFLSFVLILPSHLHRG
jgi:hypothetical protein